MDLIYCLVPKDGSLNLLIDRKAKELAAKFVTQTANTMKLEDQENSKTLLRHAAEEIALSIKNEMPKTLWDKNYETIF